MSVTGDTVPHPEAISISGGRTPWSQVPGVRVLRGNGVPRTDCFLAAPADHYKTDLRGAVETRH